MNSNKTTRFAGALASCSAGLFLALVAMASPAGADPVVPAEPLVPVSIVPPPPPATTVQSADTDAVAAQLPPDGVPHLASPDALPPGSTLDPSVVAGESPNVSYLKGLWQAVQDGELSGTEALVLGFAQRDMNTPYPDQPPGPTVPITPGDPAQMPLPPPPLLPAPPTP